MKNILFILILLNLAGYTLYAQKDTTIELREVLVSSEKNNYSSGLKIETTDSVILTYFNSTSLTEVIREKSALSIKEYGPGQLSTVSLRGGSAYHTPLLWNGFLLTSPLNGLSDLSLQQNFFFDEVSIRYGGTSYLWGSGAMSGSIHLDNKPQFNSGLLVSGGFNLASYSGYTGFTDLRYGNNSYSGTLKIYGNSIENNFRYYDPGSKSYAEQVNSGITYFGFMNEHSIKTSQRSILNFKIWYSDCDRKIPPSLNQVHSNGWQKDKNLRLSGEWKYTGLIGLNLRTALLKENIQYNDEFQPLLSDNTGNSWVNEVTLEKYITRTHFLHAGINYTFSSADSSSTISESAVNNISVFGLYRYRSYNEKLEMTISTRYEDSDVFDSPFIFSGGASYCPLNFFTFRMAGSKVYRNPTINDLYWTPGGNKELKPENGFSTEADITANINELFTKPGALTITLQATVYHKEINDWIIWYPGTSTYWSPQNLLMVVSKGIETGISISYRKNLFSSSLETDYCYTQSTNEKATSPNDASLNKQLIYVPLHRWTLRANASYKQFSLRFSHSFMGLRYTSSDNSESLDPYILDNLYVEKVFLLKANVLKLHFRINNIFNSIYQSVENRPMPLRTYECGIAFTFIKN